MKRVRSFQGWGGPGPRSPLFGLAARDGLDVPQVRQRAPEASASFLLLVIAVLSGVTAGPVEGLDRLRGRRLLCAATTGYLTALAERPHRRRPGGSLLPAVRWPGFGGR